MLCFTMIAFQKNQPEQGPFSTQWLVGLRPPALELRSKRPLLRLVFLKSDHCETYYFGLLK